MPAIWRRMNRTILPAKDSRRSWRLPKRMPDALRAARAEGKLVLEESREQQPDKAKKFRRGALGAGALILAALAVYEAIEGKMTFALRRRSVHC